MSYACVRSFHYILLEIKLEQGLVTVLDSRQKDPETYAGMTKILNKYVQLIIIAPYRQLFVHFLISQVVIIFFVFRVWKKFTAQAPGLPAQLRFDHLKVSTSY